MSWTDVVPAGYAAMSQLEKYTRSTVEPTVLHLIKVRASMLNGCGFCLDMHTQEALADGDHQRRLFAVAAWREAPFFDERERAALALTESVTVLTEGFVPDTVHAEAAKHFDDRRLAHLIALIVAINNWNRVMVSRRIPPGGHRS